MLLVVDGMATPTASRTLRVHHLLRLSRLCKIVFGHQQVNNLAIWYIRRLLVNHPSRLRDFKSSSVQE